MASPKYKNKKSGTSYEYRRIQYPVPLADGTSIVVWVDPEIMEEKGSDGVTHLYPQEDRQEYLLEQIDEQYDLSPGQMIAGALQEFSAGVTSFTNDEMLGGFNAAAGYNDGDLDKNIDAVRAEQQMFQMNYPLVTTALQTAGFTVPSALDMLIGTRGAASTAAFAAGRAASKPLLAGTPTGGLVHRSMLTDASQTMRDTMNPLRLGSANRGLGGKAVFESASKGGLFGAGAHLGDAEGSLGERSEGMGGPTMGGFVLGGAIPAALGMGSKLMDKSAWQRNPFTKPGRRTALQDKTRQSIVAGENEVSKTFTALDDELNAAIEGRPARSEEFWDRELGFSRTPYYRDASGQAISTSPANITLGHAARPRDTDGRMVGPLAARSNEGRSLPGDAGLPFLGRNLSSLFNWAGRLDPQQSQHIANRLESTGFGNQAQRINRLIRSATGESAIAFNLRKKLADKGARAKEIWGQMYDRAYFAPGTTMSGERIPRYVNLSSDGAFIRMMRDSKTIFTKALTDARIGREADIGQHKKGSPHSVGSDWQPYIDGVSQQVPSLDMLLSGQRLISKSSWDRNKGRLGAGWRPVREKGSRGHGKMKEQDGHYVIENTSKPVDVKTMHDIRAALYSMADNEKNTRLQGQYGGLARRFDEELKSAAGEEFRLADKSFSNWQDTLSAGESGKTALLNKKATPQDLSAEFNALKNAEERSLFRAGMLQELGTAEVSAADVLSNKWGLRDKIRATFVGDDEWGRFIGELANTRHAADMLENIRAPLSGASKAPQEMFNSMLWTVMSKLPAYKFSAPFALSRDLTNHQRTISSSKNKIIAKEILRLGKAQSPTEISRTLEELSVAYRRLFPEDASQLAQLASTIRQALAPQEQDIAGPNKVAKELYGLLGGST